MSAGRADADGEDGHEPIPYKLRNAIADAVTIMPPIIPVKNLAKSLDFLPSFCVAV